MLLYHSQTLNYFFISIMFYLQVIDFVILFQGYQRVNISYLFIHAIDNITWQARVGYIQQFKTIVQNKNKKNRGMLHHTVYSLYLFLTFILITQVNNLHQVSSRLTKNISTYFHLRFLKKKKNRYYCAFVAFCSKFTVLMK